MKDTIRKISYDSVNRLLEFCSDNWIDYECVPGVLLDSYLIYSNKSVGLWRIAPRNYIIIKEKYKNPWESEYVARFTDNDELAKEFELALDKSE